MARRSGDLKLAFSSLVELLQARAERDAGRAAYAFLDEGGGEAAVTYGELWARARAIGARLTGMTKPGDRALLLHPPGNDFLAAFFGALAARVAPVPLPLPGARSGLDKLSLVAEDSGAGVALTVSSVADEIRAGLAPLAVEATDAVGVEEGVGFELPVLPPDGLAYLQYTSGSTGIPRGVMVSHANVLHNLANIDEGFRHAPDSVVVSWLPHFHDMGLIYGLLAPLYHRIPCYFMAPAQFVRRPAAWLEAITRYRATHSGGPNFAYDLCVRRIPPEARATLDLRSWEVAFNGAEPVHAETLDRFTEAFSPCGFRRAVFHPAYGLAEASLKATGGEKDAPPVVFVARQAALSLDRAEQAEPGGPDARPIVGCGRAGLDTRVAIVDPESRQRRLEGEVGEIWVAGPGVALGYWNREEETRETFQATLAGGEGPFLRTGDLGFLRNRELFIAGRIKDLIIIRGLNHHPSDIELTARRAHPEIASSVCAAFSVDAGGEERLVIAVEAGRQAPAEPEAIASAIRQATAEAHQVRTYAVALVARGGIPKTSSGKIPRGLCRSLYLAGKLDVVWESAPEETGRDEEALELDRGGLLAMPGEARKAAAEEYVRRRLAILLKRKVSEIDASKPFTAYGIDSLGALELQNRMEQDFGVRFEAGEPVAEASAEELAARLVTLIGQPPADGPIPARGCLRGPLSFEQERLWLLDQVAPRNPAHAIPSAIRIEGPLQREALEGALRDLAERQESLRSRFVVENGAPVAEVAPLASVHLAITEADGLDAVRRLASEEAAAPFRLDEAPLFRARLYRLGENDHVLLLTIHHIISDLWSVRLFFGELFTFYSARVEGMDAGLPPLPACYSDYAAWQRERLQGAKLEALTARWRGRLEGAAGIELPPDRPRKKAPVAPAATEYFTLTEDAAAALRALCRRESVTPFVALLAGFEVLAARWSGQTDITLGVTGANRGRPEMERLIGFFAAPLPVRLDLGGDPDFLEIMRRARRETTDASAHSELPFAKVVEAARTGRRADHAPLVNVMFSVFRSPLPPAAPRDLSFSPVDVGPAAADFDLFVTLVEEGKELRGTAAYNAGLYDSETVRAAMGAYRRILEVAVAAPATRLSEFPVTAALKAAAHRRAEDRPTIAVAATFTAEPVDEVLRFWMKELDFDYRIRFAPYNQVFQQLLNGSSLIGAHSKGLNVVLARIEDWAHSRTAPDAGELRDTAARFIAALEAAVARSGAPVLVVVCPASPGFLSEAAGKALQGELEERIAAAFASVSAVHVVRPAEIETLYPVALYHDAHGERLGHVPYTPEFHAALGTTIARKLHAMRSAPYKALTLDCDQTLWSGVCGEDGPAGVSVDAPQRALQEFALQQRRAGMLLCLVTKNNEDDVWATFDAHPEMPLRTELLTGWRVNWRPKSENLRSLAAELELGLDSFIHIDDNPGECAEIEANCPEALALKLPRDPGAIDRYLWHVWAFDRLSATGEDRNRAAMYAENVERRALQRRTATLAEFLKALNLQIRISTPAHDQAARIAQMTQRTNQMNFTTIRRREHEIREALERGGAECLVVELNDRFGAYGIVGVMIFRAAGQDLEVDTFLVSCRALGRGVEHRMTARLGEIATERGLGHVVLRVIPTAKNQPARDFVESVGALWREPADAGAVYRLPAAYAASIVHSPSRPSDPAETKAAAGPEKVRRAIDYHRIATELDDAGKILRQIRATLHTGAVTRAAYAPPRTPLEKELAALWEEMLRAPQVGVDDNFFDLGGHSLLAVQLLSRIRERYSADLPLDVVFTGNFCVAELAKAIEIHEIERAGAEQYAELLTELEGLSDDEVRALLEQELHDDAARSGESG
ncbi:MAG: HAD-IIIC family phosphatase [Bryobacteraceae bacterium]|nr:HAD-IIIC family phosphatase [Bryobacteraceae bacterium]